MAVTKYTRVKDKATGHEYDVLAHKVDPKKHEPLKSDRYPDVSRPREPKPNVKSVRPTAASKRSQKSDGDPAAASDGDPS